MQQMILPSTPITPENHHNFMEKGTFDAFKQKNGLTTDIIPGNRLYLSTGMCKGPAISHTDLKMLGPEQSKKIKTMIDTYGEDVTMAVAETLANVDTQKVSDVSGGIGATTTIVSNKINPIVKGMNEVKELIERHNKIVKIESTPPRVIWLSKLRIEEKVKKLNNKFHTEIGIQIAKREQIKNAQLSDNELKSKNKSTLKRSMKFNFNSRSELKKLANMTRFIKIIEKKIFVLDIGIRLVSVYQDYKNGKNVGRSLLTNTAGFLAGTYLVSTMLSGVGSGAVISGGIVLSGPLLVLSLVVGAIALFYFSSGVSKTVEDFVGQAYDIALKIFNSILDIGK
ncbi:hypothetical protein MSP8887_03929 [Marinomonas spartinae]|uniref:hypothetical protein n=1 Tax=Marinomonas spartinae TaxID=1792290 RepID=UPI000808C9FC|nr:hypothetical protein [Marinomonas spartinae]SBS39657.1 hypothetical protein MSP8887_03929 [Marinomonas spartinae]